ncbi:MAG: hypothetical protein Q9209_001691 [Squamulea sp. 1 TL-2023]
MVKTSVLNDALNAINNAEKAGKRQALIRPSSKVIVKFLSVMQAMVSLHQITLRPLPFKYPAEWNLCEDLTRFPNIHHEAKRFIYRNITDRNLPGYIGEFEEVDDHRSGKIVIQLNGRSVLVKRIPFCLLTPCSINKTGVISPRYNVRIGDFEKWVVKLLPSRQFGYIVLTTSSGIMDHEEARRKHVAGKVRSIYNAYLGTAADRVFRSSVFFIEIINPKV